MSPRAPIHLGSGEPVLLLHPFMMSQNVWTGVAERIAATGRYESGRYESGRYESGRYESGRYEVVAPTMAGHNGGTPNRSWLLDSATLADDVERLLDELGWDTAHIVGNSLGGWVAFELERRNRARTITAIAPAGGWHHWSPAKFEIVFKFVAGVPVWLTAKLLGRRAARLPFSRQLASVPVSATADSLGDDDLFAIIDDVTHCPAYYQLLIKALLSPGLLELADTRTPAHLVICGKDRVLPNPRFVKHFRKYLPADTRYTELPGVGHIPMFEAPDTIANLILDFLDEHTRAGRPAG